MILQCFDCDSTLAFKTVEALVEHVLDASHPVITDLFNKLEGRYRNLSHVQLQLCLANHFQKSTAIRLAAMQQLQLKK